MDKRAAIDESILMIYRLLLISFVALVFLGVASTSYDYYIDVRDVEATIMAKQSVNCLAPKGVINFSRFTGMEKKFLEVCGYGGNLGRIYVKAEVMKGSSLELLNAFMEDFETLKERPDYGIHDLPRGRQLFVLETFEFGDSGMTWIRDIYSSGEATKFGLGELGGRQIFETRILNGSTVVDGLIVMEVFIGHEF